MESSEKANVESKKFSEKIQKKHLRKSVDKLRVLRSKNVENQDVCINIYSERN